MNSKNTHGMHFSILFLSIIFVQPVHLTSYYNESFLQHFEPIKAFQSREIHVLRNPTPTQLHKIITELHQSFPCYSDAVLALMRMYIAGSRSNQRGDFNAKIVDSKAFVIYEPNATMITQRGNEFIPGMQSLLEKIRCEGRKDLLTRLQELLMQEGYLNETEMAKTNGLIAHSQPLIQARDRWALAARQGDRPSMEDAHVMKKSLFAIFDGHGGKESADYAAKRLPVLFFNLLKTIPAPQTCFTEAFRKIDQEILKKKFASGTTAVALYRDQNRACIAWLGDSRAIVIRDNKLLVATEDHKPDNPIEQKRIERCGGFVSPAKQGGVARVNGQLAVARALGDWGLKKQTPGAVISTPSFLNVDLQSGDIIVLACDGVFDTVTNIEAAQIVTPIINGLTPRDNHLTNRESETLYTRSGKKDLVIEKYGDAYALKAVRALRDTAYNKGSADNISVLVVVYP